MSRQSYAGLLWSKQFYYYVVDEWLKGDSSMPCPPHNRLNGRNSEWKHLHNKDVISMPDKWEYPWVSFTLQLRPFPSIALCIPTAHNFTCDKRARITKWRLLLCGWTSVNHHFRENEYGDLPSFVCCVELRNKFLYATKKWAKSQR